MGAGHLAGRQQGQRPFQFRDGLGLPAAVPQGEGAALDDQRPPDGVALGGQLGEGLVEQGHRAVHRARLVGRVRREPDDARPGRGRCAPRRPPPGARSPARAPGAAVPRRARKRSWPGRPRPRPAGRGAGRARRTSGEPGRRPPRCPRPPVPAPRARVSPYAACSRTRSPGSMSSYTASRVSACRNSYPWPVWSTTSRWPSTASRRAANSSASARPATSASSRSGTRLPATAAVRSSRWAGTLSESTPLSSTSTRDGGRSAGSPPRRITPASSSTR